MHHKVYLVHTLPFDKAGQFYKGNLHTHSTLSDGNLSPQAVCDFYRTAGYDFLSLTDHFMKPFGFIIADTHAFATDDFITLIGAELHTGKTEFDQLWHILAVGLPLDFAPPTAEETGPQIAARALSAGAFVAAAHPAWYKLTEKDVLSLGAIHAIEVINGTSADQNDRIDSWYIMDILLMRGKRYTACATDDAHFHPDRDDAMRGWVHVKSETLMPEAILQALKAGHYYSSTGPQIDDVQVYPNDKIIVKCSPANRVFLVGQGSSSISVYGNGLREVELSLANFKSAYGHIIVRDAHGERAWTNPFWFE